MKKLMMTFLENIFKIPSVGHHDKGRRPNIILVVPQMSTMDIKALCREAMGGAALSGHRNIG